MAEVPLVIVDVQRLGPSTGGATTVGQGDINMARWGTGGGYPIIVLAPSSIEECYSITQYAFELAVRFQCPVIVLSDKELNLTTATVTLPRDEKPSKPQPIASVPLGFGEKVVRHRTGSTHDEFGHITKDPNKILAMNQKLMSKIMDYETDIARVQLDIEKLADTLFISFGVTARSMVEAVPICRMKGKRVSSIILNSLWPIPTQALTEAANCVRRVVVGELNPGLYAREMKCLFPNKEIVSLHRLDGSMIPPEDFVRMCF
jgi:2-oxoglutarate ferredoxin oxidoreductase subunit alpha